MSLVKYRPQLSLDTFFGDGAFDIIDGLFNRTSRSNQGSHPLTNIREDDSRFVIEISAPGNQKDEFNVSVDNDELVISLSRNEKSEEGDERKGYYRREFRSEAFEKRFYLDNKMNKEDIHATYNAGILEVEIPKVEPAKPVSVKIK